MKRWVFVGAVAGISLLTPYTVAVLAKRFPNSPIASFNTTLHNAEA
jgi:hypothetical protein